MPWSDLTARILIAFFILLLITRLMGNKQLSQLTFFNYITGITIGTIAATLVIDKRFPIIQGIYSLIFWGCLTILMGYVSLKSSHARKILSSEPTILIKKGEIIKDALSQNRLNLDDLGMLLRKANTFDIKEVDYAILESNGELSVLKKTDYQNVTKKDMFIPAQPIKNLPTEIIADRKVIMKNLTELNLDMEWLNNEINKQGYQKIDEILYAEITSQGDLFVLPSRM